MELDTAKIVDKLWNAVSTGKITSREWKTATEGIKIIKKALR